MISIKIMINDQMIKEMKDFAFATARKVNSKEFNQVDAKERPINEVIRDKMIGKLGELAFQSFLMKKFNIKVEVDLNVYKKGIGDDQDILLFGRKVEIKSVRSGNKYLMVERDIVSRKKKMKTNPNLFVLVEVGWNRKEDQPLDFANIKGFCGFYELVKKKNLFLKGKNIPNTNSVLSADNFILHHSKLHENFGCLIYQLLEIGG